MSDSESAISVISVISVREPCSLCGCPSHRRKRRYHHHLAKVRPRLYHSHSKELMPKYSQSRHSQSRLSQLRPSESRHSHLQSDVYRPHFCHKVRLRRSKPMRENLRNQATRAQRRPHVQAPSKGLGKIASKSLRKSANKSLAKVRPCQHHSHSKELMPKYSQSIFSESTLSESRHSHLQSEVSQPHFCHKVQRRRSKPMRENLRNQAKRAQRGPPVQPPNKSLVRVRPCSHHSHLKELMPKYSQSRLSQSRLSQSRLSESIISESRHSHLQSEVYQPDFCHKVRRRKSKPMKENLRNQATKAQRRPPVQAPSKSLRKIASKNSSRRVEGKRAEGEENGEENGSGGIGGSSIRGLAGIGGGIKGIGGEVKKGKRKRRLQPDGCGPEGCL